MRHESAAGGTSEERGAVNAWSKEAKELSAPSPLGRKGAEGDSASERSSNHAETQEESTATVKEKRAARALEKFGSRRFVCENGAVSKSRGSIGAGTGGIDKAPWRVLAEGRKRASEEARWAKKCGPVTTRFVDPATLKRDTKS